MQIRPSHRPHTRFSKNLFRYCISCGGELNLFSAKNTFLSEEATYLANELSLLCGEAMSRGTSLLRYGDTQPLEGHEFLRAVAYFSERLVTDDMWLPIMAEVMLNLKIPLVFSRREIGQLSFCDTEKLLAVVAWMLGGPIERLVNLNEAYGRVIIPGNGRFYLPSRVPFDNASPEWMDMIFPDEYRRSLTPYMQWRNKGGMWFLQDERRID